MTEKPDLSKSIENARSLLSAALATYKQLDVDLYAQQTNNIKNYLWLSVSIIGGLWAIVIQAEPNVLDHLFSFALWKATFIPTLGVSLAMIWLSQSISCWEFYGLAKAGLWKYWLNPMSI